MGYEKQINWKRGDGEQVTVTVSATIHNADGVKTVNADGHRVEVAVEPTASVKVSVKSKGIGSFAGYRHLDEPLMDGKVTAAAGRLMIAKDNDAKIMAAIAEAKKVAAKATGRQYDDDPNNLRPLPTAEFDAWLDNLGQDSDVCPHCGTYCDGDCQAH